MGLAKEAHMATTRQQRTLGILVWMAVIGLAILVWLG